jgi:hypothetical protein
MDTPSFARRCGSFSVAGSGDISCLGQSSLRRPFRFCPLRRSLELWSVLCSRNFTCSGPQPEFLSQSSHIFSVVYSHFGITAELAETRLLTFSPAGSAEAAIRFGFLHDLSLGIFIGVGISVTALIWLHARADAQSFASG